MPRNDDDPRVAQVLSVLDAIGAPCACGSPFCPSEAVNGLMFDLLEAISWRDCGLEALGEILRTVLARVPSRELDDVVAVAREELELGRVCQNNLPPNAPIKFGGGS